jgi:alpha-tubulin suppressor-like RCC1 family protein
VVVPSLNKVVAIASGSAMIGTIHADGAVSMSGSNNKGQLGDRSSSTATSPVRVIGISNVKALNVGQARAQ